MKIDAMKILQEMRETRDAVASGKITVEQAQAEARIFTVMAKTMACMIEHAKATERLKKGSNALPSFVAQGDD